MRAVREGRRSEKHGKQKPTRPPPGASHPIGGLSLVALSPVTLPSLATGSRGKPFFCFYLLLFPREKRENDAPLLLPLVTHWSRVLQHYGCRLTRRRGGGILYSGSAPTRTSLRLRNRKVTASLRSVAGREGTPERI